MTALLLLAAFAASSHAAPDACGAAYDEAYQASWAISREQWNADCATGTKPEDILRQQQKRAMEDCRRYFAPYADKAKVADWNLGVYCAQGPAGESTLATMTGAPSRRSSASTPAPTVKTSNVFPGRDPAVNQARRVYNQVETEGSLLPNRFVPPNFAPPSQALPAGRIRYRATSTFEVYIPMQTENPICVTLCIGINNLKPFLQLWDQGCTGRVETMTFSYGVAGQKLQKYRQEEIDAAFAEIEKILNSSRSEFNKPQ